VFHTLPRVSYLPEKNETNVNGLTFVRQMRDKKTNYPPIGEFVGFRILDVERGTIRVSGRPTAQHYNPLGVVHGGFASTLMDLALGHVSLTVLASMEEGVATTDLSVKFVRPIFEKTGELTCEATVVHSGRKVIIAEARLMDTSGKLYATAQSTCLVVPNRTEWAED
jgi:uncharacterized protein (TIGR00369 family)